MPVAEEVGTPGRRGRERPFLRSGVGAEADGGSCPPFARLDQFHVRSFELAQPAVPRSPGKAIVARLSIARPGHHRPCRTLGPSRPEAAARIEAWGPGNRRPKGAGHAGTARVAVGAAASRGVSRRGRVADLRRTELRLPCRIPEGMVRASLSMRSDRWSRASYPSESERPPGPSRATYRCSALGAGRSPTARGLARGEMADLVVQPSSPGANWNGWAGTDSNRRSPPCKGDVVTAGPPAPGPDERPASWVYGFAAWRR